MILEPNIRYYPEADTMAIELRPYPRGAGSDTTEVGGQDEAGDLVVHYAADGAPWLWEIEHAFRTSRVYRDSFGENPAQRNGSMRRSHSTD